MIDFNHRNPTERITALIDQALQVENVKQTPRSYLGGSRLGQDCLRAMQFEFFHTPPDPGKELSGKALRIFAVGHALEEIAIRWIRKAGFNLLTTKPDGHQYGFSVAKGLIQGHIDGVIVGGPDILRYPALWEMKTMNSKNWKDCVAHGVKSSKPIYYAQIQIYQAYMQLDANPALFTALNKDTQELYFELVDFDSSAAQFYSDRGVQVIQSCAVGEQLPKNETINCRWCNWTDKCHG